MRGANPAYWPVAIAKVPDGVADSGASRDVLTASPRCHTLSPLSQVWRQFILDTSLRGSLQVKAWFCS